MRGGNQESCIKLGHGGIPMYMYSHEILQLIGLLDHLSECLYLLCTSVQPLCLTYANARKHPDL